MLHVTPLFAALVTVAVNCRDAPSATVAVPGETETATGAMLTVALADLVTSDCDVAVTVMLPVLGAMDGAVYRPALLMAPQAAPVQPEPETLHVTAVLTVPLTLALNCCVAPAFRVVVAGVIATLTGGMVTLADADFEASACETAETVTVFGLGATAGAV